jgi:hypothetical protein
MSKAVTVELYKKASGRNVPNEYLVRRGDVVVGVVMKYPNTKTEQHPWTAIQAYTGELIGHYWGENAKAMAVMAASG